MSGMQGAIYTVRDSHDTMKAKLPLFLAVDIVAAEQGEWEDEKAAPGRRIRVTKGSVIPLSMGSSEIRLYLWKGDTLSIED